MNRRAKLIEKLLTLPTDMPFDEVSRVLEMHGFVHQRSRGSHHSFSDGETTLIVPTVGGRSVKRVYLMQILAALGLRGELE